MIRLTNELRQLQCRLDLGHLHLAGHWVFVPHSRMEMLGQ